VQLLVEKYHTPCHLSIYGEGELRLQLQALIDQLGLKSAITLHGFVPDLAAKLAENDVFLLSSTWEGFGNVLVEALDAGLRIVSTDCPSGPKEILANGKFGALVPLDDAEQMAQAIIAAAAKPAMRNHAELHQHLQQFTNSQIVKEYSQLIASIVN
jgi:glycosyltransferase involved in cell wall biosynthesis